MDDDTIHEYARLAQGAYTAEEIPGYEIDRALSGDSHTTYVKDGIAHVAYRGTQLSGANKNRFKDLGDDALIALGLQHLSRRFKRSAKVANAARMKYDKVVLTGHSLGASQALHAHVKTGYETHAFNPGISPIDVARSRSLITGKHVADYWKKPVFGDNARAYVSNGDAVSDLTRYVSGLWTHRMSKKEKNAHSIKNFLKG